MGIRDEDVTFLPGSNVFELGHGFSLAQDRRVRDARFYTNDLPPGWSQSQARQFSIYPRGREAESGPIKEVIIPVTFGSITGSGFSIAGATTVAAALWRSGDASALVATYTGGIQEFTLFFGVNDYPELAAKRILNVSMVYSGNLAYLDGNVQVNFIDPDVSTPVTFISITNNAGTQTESFRGNYSAGPGALSDLVTTANANTGTMQSSQKYGYINFGDVTGFWNTTTSPALTSTRLPWRYVDLQRFEAGAANRLQVYGLIQLPNPAAFELTGCRLALDYVALRVLYCEEQRVSYGGSIAPFIQGMNSVPLYDTNNATDPVLTAGDYTALLSWVSPGQVSFTQNVNSNFPTLNGLRELYPIPDHPGIQVNVPFPLADNVGSTFTKETVHVLPQLSLHTSGGPLTEVHVYGRQAKAEIYGTVTATQEIQDIAAQATASYPWVRYYARRFGDTTIPLRLENPSVSGAGTAVELTPADWDALDEIVDGWKEVTLRFVTPPTMGAGTNPQYRWSAPGENIGNRWEVLGVTAPALSGNPANLKLLVPSPNQLSTATYGTPTSGATINLGWVPQYAPTVTATTDDQTSDAVLIFAQDLPTVTGFAVEVMNQAVSGIGQDCGVDPCCIPTEIFYNQLVWSLPGDSDVVTDAFDRTVVNGWGTTDTGGAWTVSTASAFAVDGDEGTVAPALSSTSYTSLTNLGWVNFDITVTAGITSVISGVGAEVGLIGRATDISNYYYLKVNTTSAGVTTARIGKRVAASNTDLLSVPITFAGGAGAMFNLRFVMYGGFIRAKVWMENEAEPDYWILDTYDTSLVTGSQVGTYSLSNTSTSNTMAYENFSATPPGWWFSKYELQRMDTVETEWQTIMAASSPGQYTFNDFEARVGIQSTYRIRMVDVYDFPGPWSASVSATIPDPGVEIECDGGHLLIFTSNERQDGSANLAYSSVWEGRVEEPFVFPEADFVQLQAMYGRDFFTAFRPTERGGERFSRTVLVQAAAIDPETLADFTGLRDMAWADTSYICVRDEDGNRWFATVIVPGGRVTHSRKLYMAPVEIVEVTAVPSEVDP